eukprot:TRINITY_DN6144_c0_g1_i3.p2 TRINITY_DN6144_c0_g1~~TRINITY_DN6144_c0_g1_i3.p2  ORF type:complete len:200 (-),score=70.63 TRINITY_DN6144_c0_g1_i3:121-720(-)
MQPANIIVEGELSRQGGRLKNWKRRWCVLTDSALLCFKLPTDAEKRATKYASPQGSIEVGSIETVEPFGSDKQKKRYFFKLATPDRTLVMAAATLDDAVRWIQAVQQLKRDGPDLFAIAAGSRDLDLDLSGKSLDELQTLLGSMDAAAKSDIQRMLDQSWLLKDMLIDELEKRDAKHVKDRYATNRNLLMAELARRTCV